jgi:hypothetical protein
VPLPPPKARGLAWLVAPLLVLSLLASAAAFASAGPTPRQAAAKKAAQGFTVGLVSGPAAAWEARTIVPELHPRMVRFGLSIDTSLSELQKQIAGLSAKGEEALPMAEFYGRIPSTAEAQHLAAWARAYGPGGTFWRGRRNAHPIHYIEFGNETNESYQFGGVSSGPSYIARAKAYARRAKAAISAIKAANPGVGLLVQGDNGGCGCSQWVDGMFSAVPDLNRRVAGWTAHPYGPPSRYAPILSRMVSDTAKHGDRSLPFFLTEYGISSDNGRCLSGNYRWPRCLTYARAAADMHRSIGDMRAKWGSRIAALFIFEQRDMQPHGSTSNREGYFGAVQHNGGRKGPYTSEIEWEINTYRG